MEKITPIIREDHPEQYNSKPYLTCIVYQDSTYITIIDNYSNKNISCYVIDHCEATLIDIGKLFEVADKWWEEGASQPISIYLSRHNMGDIVNVLFRTFHEDHIKRVIGPIQSFEVGKIFSIKRRKYRDVKNIALKKAP